MTPPDSQARLQSAARLYESGRAGEAESICREVLKKDGRNLLALRILALSCARSMRWNDAVRSIEKARKLAPKDPAILLNASTVMIGLGRFDDALSAVRQAQRLSPRDPRVGGMFAEALVYANRHAECVEFLREAATRGPLPANAVLSYVDACIEVGDLEEAIRAGRAFLEHDAGRDPQAGRPVASSVGRALEKMGRTDEAAATWTAMNGAIEGEFDPKAAIDLVDRLIERFPKSRFADRTDSKASGSRRPVFIVGLARSGTSLVERVVGAHPDAHGIGESTLLDEVLESRLQTRGAETVMRLVDADPSVLELVRSDYLKGLQALGGRRERIANKSLLLPREAGAIGLLFPEAAMLFTSRRATDTAMSIFANTFDPILMAWTSRMEHIGVMSALHDRLVEHWRSVLPNPMLVVDYEALARTPGDVVPGILETCGLPMDEACLAPEKAARDAKGGRFMPTLSEQQVRKPINTDAIGRAEAYGELIADFERGRRMVTG